MTGRGWWTLFFVALALAAGVALSFPSLALVALTLLLWLLAEWLLFCVRVRFLLRKAVVERQILDERGPVATLWAGQSFAVRVALTLGRAGRIPFVAASDPVPFGVAHEAGPTTADGPLAADSPLAIEYRVHCPAAGLARFEGLRVEVADLHGLFAHVGFVRAPVVLRVLPRVRVPRPAWPLTKRSNQLPPPGMHRLRQPGSGSELLDLRDYQPGDPPRTIAWKVSARRDKLVTRDYENEVPVRCTLFLDASSGVRVPSPPEGGPKASLAHRPLDQLVEIAAGAVRGSVAARDLTALCVFDESSSRLTPAKRTARHATELMRALGEAAGLAPVAAHADPEPLAPVAYALAREVYPDLLRQEVNRTPFWLTWFAEDAVFSRHRRGVLARLYRRKRRWVLWATLYLPFWLFVVNVLSLFVEGIPDAVRSVLAGLFVFGSPALMVGSRLLFHLSLIVNGGQRRRARARKQLSALFAGRYGPCPGGMQLMMEDDDLFSLYLQRFLAEHQVPVAMPLYDEKGRYLYSCVEKVGVLAKALTRAAAHGRDNELFVVLADLLELDDAQLEPLTQAVRVAVARHHSVVVVVCWPRGVPAPRGGEVPRPPKAGSLGGFMTELAWGRAHAGYARLRRTFTRLGVPVASAGADESVALILDRMQRLRAAGGRR